MIRIFCALFISVASFAYAKDLPAEKPPESITIGLIPGGNPEKLKAQSLELAKALQEKLQIPVTIYISKNYAGLAEAMKSKKVDFAFFTSSTFVLAEQQAQAKVLLKTVWQEPYYYSALITAKTSGIKKLQDLKGKKVAFVDEKSSSGYLYPQVALQKQKMTAKDFKEVVFSGNHQASMQLLEQGQVDAAAVYSDDDKGRHSAWSQFAKDPKKYRVVWMSEPIPSDPFCVRGDFYEMYPKVTHSLMFALIDLFQIHREKKTYSEILGSRDLMPATSKQYDPVREMVKALKMELNP